MPSTTVYVKEVYYKRLQVIAEQFNLSVGGVITEAVEYALSDEKNFVESIEEELPEEEPEEELPEEEEELEEVPEEEVEEEPGEEEEG